MSINIFRVAPVVPAGAGVTGNPTTRRSEAPTDLVCGEQTTGLDVRPEEVRAQLDVLVADEDSLGASYETDVVLGLAAE